MSEPNVAVYVPVTFGSPSIDLSRAKEHLRVENAAEDDFINHLVEVATQVGETHTRRSFRVTTWRLLLDEFSDPICIRRHPVASVISVKRLVSGVLTTVTSTVYWLKQLEQGAEIRLMPNMTWPSDQDERQQAIEVEFVTGVHPRIEVAEAGILRVLAHLYENRGDCDLPAPLLLDKAGATMMFDQLRVVRV